MEREKIAELFMKGIDCSQVVAGAFAEELGITQKHIRWPQDLAAEWESVKPAVQ